MSVENRFFSVPIGGYDMRLRPSEVEAVTAGLGASQNEPLERIVGAVAALSVSDRAPAWELALRHYGRRKPLEQAAGEIGMDVIRARALVEQFASANG
jgi:hypothetical protein